MANPLASGQAQQKTTKTKQKLSEAELFPVYEEMIPKFLEGKKKKLYSGVDQFLNSSDSNPLTSSQRATFNSKKNDYVNLGAIREREQNTHRNTKHRHSKDLLGPELIKWINEKEVNNGKMKTII